MKITEELLRRKHACASQLALFIETFPNGAEVTEAACIEVASKQFRWSWAAANLLLAALLADYEAKCAPLAADYATKRAPLAADYATKRAPLYADYEAKCAPLYADYEAKRAALFGRLAEKAKDAG